MERTTEFAAKSEAIASAKWKLKDQRGWAWSFVVFGLLFLASAIALSISRVDLPARVWSLVCSPADVTLAQIASGKQPYQINWRLSEYSKTDVNSQPKFSNEGNYVGAYFELKPPLEPEAVQSKEVLVYKRGSADETDAFGKFLENGKPFHGHFYMPKSTATGKTIVSAESHVKETAFYLCIVFVGLVFFGGAAFHNFRLVRKTIAKLDRLQGIKPKTDFVS